MLQRLRTWISQFCKLKLADCNLQSGSCKFLLATLAIFIAAYLAWLRFSPPPPKPGMVIAAAPPPKAVADQPVKVVNVPVIVYRDRVKVIEKLGLPPSSPREEVQTAFDIPRLKYGGTGAVFVNTTTGQSRTAIIAKEAPWISFERDNEINAGVKVGTSSRRAEIEYRRDILQVKGVGVMLTTGASASIDGPMDPEWNVAAKLKYSW